MRWNGRLAIAGTALLAWSAGPAVADPSPSSWSGVPAQVIPTYLEPGAPAFTTRAGNGTFSTGQNGDGTGSTGTGAPYAGGGGAAMANMMAQSYGQTAYATAQQLGNDPAAVAGIGQIESGFRNVSTANGSSSATGPWQITSGTWGDYVSRYNLPYTASDRTNPDAQAVVANYIIRDYAAGVSATIGQPATVQQAYGAYVFGPTAGGNIANASQGEPLSNYVPARSLANNNMAGWTVGQFYALVGSKIGDVATRTVRS